MAPIIPYAGRITFANILAAAIQAGGFANLPPTLARASFLESCKSKRQHGLNQFRGNRYFRPRLAIFVGRNRCRHCRAWPRCSEFRNHQLSSYGGPVPVSAWGYWVDCIDPITGLRALLWCQQWDQFFSWLAVGQNYPLNLSLGLGQC